MTYRCQCCRANTLLYRNMSQQKGLNDLQEKALNMITTAQIVEQSEDETDKQDKQFDTALDKQNELNSFVNKSSKVRIAIHGMSELINTRLSTEALEICLMLIDKGVHPRALAEVVLHILDVRLKRNEKEHGPTLP